MDTLIAGGSVAAIVFLLVLAVLGLLMPLMLYSAQRSAYRCYQELRSMNAHLAALKDQTR